MPPRIITKAGAGSSNSSSPVFKKKAGNAPPQQKGGWGKVVQRKAQTEARSSKNKPVYLDIKNKFYLVDGETVTVQFLTDEPVCVEGVLLPPDHRDFYVSRKEVDRHCPFVERNLPLQFKVAFKVLDYRGTYDSKTKTHNFDKPVEKYWLTSNTVGMQLKTLVDRKNKPLSQMVLDVTRSGADKNTTYNFEMSLDANDYPKRPVAFNESLPSLSDALKPLDRQVILALLGEEFEDDGTEVSY